VVEQAGKSSLRVAAVQLTSTDDIAANLARAEYWVRYAAQRGAQLITLPENYGFLGSQEGETLAHAQDIETGPFVAPFRVLARELGVGILLGSMPEHGPDSKHIYNTQVLIGRQGETLARYRKIHLFDVQMGETTLRESAQVVAGKDVVTGVFDGWCIGLSICYDLRFPELYRRLGEAGAEVMCIPAAFTLHTGKDHWDVLLRARAIENQVYVIAAAQWGRHNAKRMSWGKSLVCDPWGEVVACAREGEGVAIGEIDAEYQARVRQGLPALQHRRL
jgi:predicted amidohydrolase